MVVVHTARHTSQDGKRKYRLFYFSHDHHLPKTIFLPEFDPNRSVPRSRTIYDPRREENSDVQYYWACVPRIPYFTPSEQAHMPAAHTMYETNVKYYRSVLVEATKIRTSLAEKNSADKPRAATCITSYPPWVYSGSRSTRKKRTKSSTPKRGRRSRRPRKATATSEDSSLPVTPPSLDGLDFSTEQSCQPFMQSPPMGCWLCNTTDASMDAYMGVPLFAGDITAPDFGSPLHLGASVPVLPSFALTANDWEAPMCDPMVASQHGLEDPVPGIVAQDTLAFGEIDSNVAYNVSSLSYIPCPHELALRRRSNPLFVDKLADLHEEIVRQTAIKPAKIEDLGPLELACVIRLSERFRGRVPIPSAVIACAMECGMPCRRVIAYFFTLNPEPFLPVFQRQAAQEAEAMMDYISFDNFNDEAEEATNTDFPLPNTQAFEEASLQWLEEYPPAPPMA